MGIPLALYLIGLVLPRDRTYNLGYKVGRFLTLLGQRKLGAKKWERLEDRIQATVSDFIDGVYAGLGSDEVEAAKD